jgi:Coenzyme PQQ synthesis protein D (PqqD)
MTDGRIPKRSVRARTRDIRGTLHLAYGGEVFELGGVGSDMWKLIDGKRTVDEIAATIADGHDVEPEAAAHDAREFLDELAAAQLIEWRDTG